MVRFNTDSLVMPLTPQELQILKQRRRNGEFGPHRSSAWLLVLILLIFVVAFSAIIINLLTATGSRFTGPPKHFLPLAIASCIVLVVAIPSFIRNLSKARRRRMDWALLARFADANGMRFGIRSADPNYPGLLFNKGHSRASTLHLFSPTGVLADAGCYEYTTGSGKESTTYRWRFAAFRLPHPVPHLLLDAKANNGRWGTNLPETFASSQRISLGEPFDSHYQLYAPEGYGRDAFYLLPPNVMEALLNTRVVYDIEMVDDWLFCYTGSAQDLTNPDTWRLLETIANGVLGSIAPVVGRYSDPRALAETAGNTGYGPGTPVQVAPQGKRLRRGVNISAFICFAIFLAYMILTRLLRLPG
ncbi:hypothetical protein [Arachnia propionica]|uniref:hypothetical protein n=1 Tax=Arachnia propionica TaxID=1750 RepID=UPI000F83478B|nr:hypothetical protein [Arachnia propionica]